MRVKPLTLAARCGVLGAILVTTSTIPAFADRDEWRWRGHHGHEWREHWRPAYAYPYAPRVIVAPPAYYAPPPVYYAPPIYYPPSVNFGFTFR